MSREVWSARDADVRAEKREVFPMSLLRCGLVAGPVFLAVLWIDGATRPGYSLWHHGASQLGTGERAWLQTGNFLLAAVLLGLFALGLRRTLPPGGRGAAWGPAFLAIAAVGLAVGGLVPTDPALGYPPGLPEGLTTAGRVHQVAGLALFAGLAGGAFALARQLPGTGRFMRISGALVIAFAFAAGIAYRLDTLGLWRPAPAGLLEHLSLVVGFCWITVLAVRLAQLPSFSRRPYSRP
ncbi:DUF998 domain-containing protein [Nonomuraea sp. NPDC059023]|uniref:DUF998 domain-containing protein n=1 Tax=unclassified Nonomuraea TaxID=2593643 RepID=UPI0036B62091